MEVYDLSQISDLIGLKKTKAKNWTNSRTGLLIEPSVRKVVGNKSGLYSRRDFHLFAVAQEFSRAGFAAKAIGKLLEVVKPRLGRAVSATEVWTVWRTATGTFRIKRGRIIPAGATLYATVAVGALLKRLDEAADARGYEDRAVCHQPLWVSIKSADCVPGEKSWPIGPAAEKERNKPETFPKPQSSLDCEQGNKRPRSYASTKPVHKPYAGQ